MDRVESIKARCLRCKDAAQALIQNMDNAMSYVEENRVRHLTEQINLASAITNRLDEDIQLLKTLAKDLEESQD